MTHQANVIAACFFHWTDRESCEFAIIAAFQVMKWTEFLNINTH